MPLPTGRAPRRPSPRVARSAQGTAPRPRTSEPAVRGSDGLERSTAGSGVLVQVRRSSPRPLVSIRGELDLSGAPLLVAVLEHVQERAGEVDVDLSEVSFADTHGLAPVLDGSAVVVATSPAVRLVLDALGTSGPAAPAPHRRGRRR